MGIKESQELLIGIVLLVTSFKKISKDGVSLADMPEAIALVKKADVIIEAVKGIDLVVDEAKDLDQEELMALGLALFAMVKKIKEA